MARCLIVSVAHDFFSYSSSSRKDLPFRINKRLKFCLLEKNETSLSMSFEMKALVRACADALPENITFLTGDSSVTLGRARPTAEFLYAPYVFLHIRAGESRLVSMTSCSWTSGPMLTAVFEDCFANTDTSYSLFRARGKEIWCFLQLSTLELLISEKRKSNILRWNILREHGHVRACFIFSLLFLILSFSFLFLFLRTSPAVLGTTGC